ncbi:E3 ubiquitin-protein ligase TRIM62-like [Trichomycterus rosablanca]|uniref:E3 ubiquitin-protein ligase TRIM62-like n=1 Tax=Trichomycterus rosablanca TaxID=2290929 RepID=UPI002F358793
MVIPDSFSFSPYESHLQFFVWKEMLGSIKPVAECLTISQDTPLIVSPDGLSVRQADIHDEDVYRHDVVYAEETFITGQHYWEIEVGAKPDWSLGLEKRKENKSFLARLMSRKPHISKVQLQLTRDKGYIVKSNQFVIPVLTDIKEKPRRIGLFLDCDNNQVCFYNADNMSLIHTFTCSFRWPWSVCLGTGMNSFPLTVCCYRANDAAFAN